MRLGLQDKPKQVQTPPVDGYENERIGVQQIKPPSGVLLIESYWKVRATSVCGWPST